MPSFLISISDKLSLIVKFALDTAAGAEHNAEEITFRLSAAFKSMKCILH